MQLECLPLFFWIFSVLYHLNPVVINHKTISQPKFLQFQTELQLTAFFYLSVSAFWQCHYSLNEDLLLKQWDPAALCHFCWRALLGSGWRFASAFKWNQLFPPVTMCYLLHAGVYVSLCLDVLHCILLILLECRNSGHKLGHPEKSILTEKEGVEVKSACPFYTHQLKGKSL